MPRAGQVKPPVEERLSDRIAIGVLTSIYPPELVDRVVAEAGRTQQRERLLPARVVVWLVLAMALFSGQAYEEVARLLAGGLGWARRWQQWFRVPSTPAIAKARARLGAEPLRRLFAEVAQPLATPGTKGAWYRGWRLLPVDGGPPWTWPTPRQPGGVWAADDPPGRAGRVPAGPRGRVAPVPGRELASCRCWRHETDPDLAAAQARRALRTAHEPTSRTTEPGSNGELSVSGISWVLDAATGQE